MGAGLKLSFVKGQHILGEPGTEGPPAAKPDPVAGAPVPTVPETPPTTEVEGRDGPDPTRYGDWEKNGRCIDF